MFEGENSSSPWRMIWSVIVDVVCSSHRLMLLHMNNIYVAFHRYQQLNFIFVIHSGNAGIMHMQLCIVCNVISVRLIIAKSAIQTKRKRYLLLPFEQYRNIWRMQ